MHWVQNPAFFQGHQQRLTGQLSEKTQLTFLYSLSLYPVLCSEALNGYTVCTVLKTSFTFFAVAFALYSEISSKK
jgi:hypothetical protein